MQTATIGGKTYKVLNGGAAILTHCIVGIKLSKGKHTLYSLRG